MRRCCEECGLFCCDVILSVSLGMRACCDLFALFPTFHRIWARFDRTYAAIDSQHGLLDTVFAQEI